MYILGIETSCDDTSVAIVENGKKIIVNLIASQEKLHKRYGGVVPEIASRCHTEVINILIEEAFRQAKLKYNQVKAVAVTYGPGLIGSLLVGMAAAKAFSFTINIPLVAVNHLEGHLYANFIDGDYRNCSRPRQAGAIDTRPDKSWAATIKGNGWKVPEVPLICLIVSGGHTEIVYMKDHGDYEVLGKTRDDAAGEAFDKVARFLGIGYPGGPVIDRLSTNADYKKINFPRPLLKDGYDFSFSGLKTALVNWCSGFKVISVVPNNRVQYLNGQSPYAVPDIVASFQEAIVDVLVEKTIKAALDKKVKMVVLAGGVASNSRLRERMKMKTNQAKVKLNIPDKKLCTDNAAMVACAGYYRFKRGETSDLNLEAQSCLTLASF